MIVEKGVDLKGVCPELKKALKIIHMIFYERGNHLIITAAKWGRDALRQPHEAGRAIDVRRPLLNYHDVLTSLKKALGDNYAVRSMHDDLHIEFIPPCGPRCTKAAGFNNHQMREATQ